MNKALPELVEFKKVASGEVFQKVFDRGYHRAGDSYEKQVAKLCQSIFQEGWLAYLKDLRTPSDHPACNAVASPIEPSDPLIIYSPLILPGFNEKEYVNQPAYKEEVVVVEEVGTTLDNKLGGGVGGDDEVAKGEGAEVAKGEGAEGAEGEGVCEGNTSTPPEE